MRVMVEFWTVQVLLGLSFDTDRYRMSVPGCRYLTQFVEVIHFNCVLQKNNVKLYRI